MDWYPLSPNSGHTFVKLVRTTTRTVNGVEKEITESVVFGLHPNSQSLFDDVHGYLENDNVNDADVTAIKEISKNNFDLVIQAVELVIDKLEDDKIQYNTATFNCTTLGVLFCEIGEMDVPQSKRFYSLGLRYGLTPSYLSKDLEAMTDSDRKEKAIIVVRTEESKEEGTSSNDDGGSSED